MCFRSFGRRRILVRVGRIHEPFRGTAQAQQLTWHEIETAALGRPFFMQLLGRFDGDQVLHLGILAVVLELGAVDLDVGDFTVLVP